MLTEGCACLWGACMIVGGHVFAGGHAWLLGACMVVGGVHGCGGACVVAWGCVGYDKIWSMSGQYASYWNAFLFHRAFKSNWFYNRLKLSRHALDLL